jgi:hypothetical protein
MENYYLCPLYSFTHNDDEIHLPEDIRIIKTPSTYIEYLERRYPHFLPAILSNTNWVIAIKWPSVDTTNLSLNERTSQAIRVENTMIDKVVDVITSLRLFKEGRVVVGLISSASLYNANWAIGNTTIWTPVSNITFFEEDSVYQLHNSEIPRLVSLFENIRTWRVLGYLEILNTSISRFHSSYHGNIENRIIDQMIAFESLYMNYEQELSFRLSLRTAFLLRNRRNFSKTIFKNMKLAYNYRSKIVHGDNPPSRDKLRHIIAKTEEYLRQSIIKFLTLVSQGKSMKQIREKFLDENILTNGETLKNS